MTLHASIDPSQHIKIFNGFKATFFFQPIDRAGRERRNKAKKIKSFQFISIEIRPMNRQDINSKRSARAYYWFKRSIFLSWAEKREASGK